MIPGGATLNFDVEIIDVADGMITSNVFAIIDTNKDGILTVSEFKKWFKDK
jgi:hypothetical protein